MHSAPNHDLCDLVEKKCCRVVSCADIATIAAHDSIFLSGRPEYDVPLGRRDELASASVNETTKNLPSPAQSASQILAALAKKSFDATNVVTLSGAHTIGLGHCGSFTDRLYPTPDPAMEKSFARAYQYEDPTTRDIVTSFAKDLELFFERFVLAMTKMGQLGLLTGTKGEIQARCSARNS
ncbi:hypothetical protein EUGRSUZ_J02563 [Eucalyptus grandis]|uniref:peroxidase n=2 Tax=Eucalyptus grandis TaxID=71139 RepID=A0A059AIT6_EUCGR|nr:hypothetical protein EUGRSUZ_J02563 [Eucalyptus grandis]